VNAAVEIAATACVVYFVVLIVALGQLTRKRRSIAIKYIALAFLAGWVLIDWLSGATGWVMIEGIVLVIAIPFGIAHLAILLIEESRQG
jgi:membrane associated rhomboid family serine protease